MIHDYDGQRYAYGSLNIQKVLGSGGFSTVYEAILDDAPVAVKKLNRQTSQELPHGDEIIDALQLFRQEISIQGTATGPSLLHHPRFFKF